MLVIGAAFYLVAFSTVRLVGDALFSDAIRSHAAQTQNLIEQAGKNQERFILNCSETLSKSTETLDSTIEKLRRKILKIMIATAVSAVVLSLLACVVFWKLAV